MKRLLWLGLLLILIACADQPPIAEPTLTATVTAIETATAIETTLVVTSTPTLLPTLAPYPIATSYPAPPATAVPTDYPAPATATAVSPTATTPAATGTPLAPVNSDLYLPIITKSQPPAPTPTATPTFTPSPSPSPTYTPSPSPTYTPTPIPTLDFASLRTQLAANNQTLVTNKIGFHVTLMEPEEEILLDDWMQQLDAAGVPIFLKSVDNAEPLYKAQELLRQSGVPHTLVFRATGGVPNYDLTPAEAARLHWEEHKALFPPELDPNLVWIETVNEVDKNRSVWLAQFALETAQLTLSDGYKWAAFGWASGEPEPAHWRLPAMQQFLQLAGDNPDRLAIALHEYSYITSDIADAYPYKVGRFQTLLQIVDELGIPHPTILITEWGWAYDNLPPIEKALADIDWANELYAPYPEIKGAALWHLGHGCCFAEISEQTVELLRPLTFYSLTHYQTR